jgi:hypothetical protein
MKQIKFIKAVILVAIMAACGQGKQNNMQNEIPSDWKIFEQNDFSIRFPDSFELNTSGVLGSSFILFPKNTSLDDKFLTNINLLIQDLQKFNISLDDYLKIIEIQIETMRSNGNLIESERVNKNNFEFQKIIYTGMQGQLKLKFEQYCIVNNEKAYILTFTAKEEHFDTYKTEVEIIMNSFIIK